MNAAQCAVYAGTCLLDLREDGGTLKEDKAKLMGALSGVVALGLAYRATR